ncbi:MAG: iron-siderophore ABC transporter substrate-binding protein [Patulibacter sp.]|nr:iron-siderophore ABC transporter substrate-binding protein [Patulibacter sp.]
MTHLFRLPRLLAVVGATLALASCGSSDDAANETTTAAAASGAFPAKVEHKFGTTTVPAAPERIVVVGLTEQDTVLALGEKPIATTEWYGEQPYAVWPWAQPALGDAKPTVLKNADGFDFERIAGLRPDLIIGTNSGMKDADYEKLSKLAPTIAGGKGSGDYFSPWTEQVLLIAEALGKKPQGQALIDGVKEQYAQVAAAHPEWKGKTVTFAQNAFYDGEIYVYPEGLNTEFLTYLGFEINPKITALKEGEGEQVGVSAERLDVIDADVIVFATEKPKDVDELEKVPTFNQLDAVQQNRAIFTDGTLAGAAYFTTPLSFPYVLEHLVPQLEAAVAGKAPRKVVETASSR